MRMSWDAHRAVGAVVFALALAALGCGKGASSKDGQGMGLPRMLDGGATDTDGGTSEGCGYTGPRLTPADYDACPACANARCVLGGLVLEKDRGLLADCADGVSKCVPDGYLETMGNVLLPTCESLQGREGRCVSTCLPLVAAQVDALPRDICRDEERCAPCYDPLTGEDTGLCRIGCDKGPSAPPLVFERCCHDLGACVPSANVPLDQRELLSDDTCANTGELCTPDPLLSAAGFVPESCESIGGGEGRCLPDCMPLVQGQASTLPKSSCAEHQLCAPCFDPITAVATGACTISNDPGPAEPPFSFPGCCGDRGSCLPKNLVDDDLESALDAADCADPSALCTPSELAADAAAAPSMCTSWNGAEGRCLLSCLPLVEKDAASLTRGACKTGHLCTPCYDPLSGDETGACALGGDPGPSGAPYTFPECCGGLARCMPKALVSSETQAFVSQGDCSESASLCVPKALIDDASLVPASCVASLGGAEGRCLPACLPQLEAASFRLAQDGCASDELCASCFDPFTGEDSGACHVGGDPGPTQSAYVFPECCGGLSACVPKSLVPDAQESSLDQGGCADAGSLCVPKPLAQDAAYVAPSCMSWNGAEGRCLPACMPDVAKDAASLTQGSCSAGQLCAPCYDPLDGSDTGACHVGGDPGPDDPAYTFPTCCGGASQCIPQGLVPDDQEPLLARLTCADANSLCVPKPLAADESFVPATCTSWGGAEGRCLLSCLPHVAANASNLTQGSCQPGELCSPCYDPITGTDDGSCHYGGDPGPTQPAYTFPTCCGGASQCLPKALVADADEALLSQGGCADANSLCVPKPLAADPDFVPATCSSWGGAEGRCLLSCLPHVAANAANLTQGSCQPGELCSPCYDPITGTDDGSCHLGGDPGPTQAAYTFPECCGGLSRCMPDALVPAAVQDDVEQSSCAAGSSCVPKTLVADASWVAPSCTSWGGGEGRCLPACLPLVAADAADLTQGSCVSGNLCTPCYDPVTGADTGACHLGGDAGPAQPKYTFPTCCSDGGSGKLGTCVPSALVPSAEQPLLGKDTCPGASDLCEPNELATDSYTPQTCSSWLGAEGRCLPACLPSVAASATNLRKDVCATGELCMPCFDQLTGSSTGACSIAGDAPASNTPKPLPACCPTPSPNGVQRGTCVPTQVAGATPPQYPTLNCETQTADADVYVCKANEKAKKPTQSFGSCTTAFAGPSCGFLDLSCSSARSTASGNVANKSGACVPSCMISEKSWTISQYGTYTLDVLYGQSTCASGEDCAPCNYPTGHPQAGQSTGLCY